MRIFVADEYPLAVFANKCRRALQIPPSAGFHDIADVREKREGDERAQMAAVLPFLEGPGPSRSTDEWRRPPFRMAALVLTGSAVDAATKLRH
jgi:hypothetical protein